MTKDYYAILQVRPGAGPDEIRKAFRRLALLHHPDKNNGDQYAPARFQEIKEAYDTLTDPGRKFAWQQERWYVKSQGGKFTDDAPIDPPHVLKQALDLNKYVSTLDVFRMDQLGLSENIRRLVSDDIIAQLLAFNEPEILSKIAETLLDASRPLQPQFLAPVAVQLKKLVTADPGMISKIDIHVSRADRRRTWQGLMVVGAVLLTLLLCLLIYLLA